MIETIRHVLSSEPGAVHECFLATLYTTVQLFSRLLTPSDLQIQDVEALVVQVVDPEMACGLSMVRLPASGNSSHNYGVMAWQNQADVKT